VQGSRRGEIDLKGFTEDYYRKLCKGKLAPVLKDHRNRPAKRVWLELVHLCIPGANDSEPEFATCAAG